MSDDSLDSDITSKFHELLRLYSIEILSNRKEIRGTINLIVFTGHLSYYEGRLYIPDNKTQKDYNTCVIVGKTVDDIIQQIESNRLDPEDKPIIERYLLSELTKHPMKLRSNRFFVYGASMITDVNHKNINNIGTMIEIRILHVCGNCKSKDITYKQCARCRETFYCSVICQAAHWPKHKMQCKKQKT